MFTRSTWLLYTQWGEGLDGGKGELQHINLAHLNMVVQSPVDIHHMWWARTYPVTEDVRTRGSLIVPCKTHQAVRVNFRNNLASCALKCALFSWVCVHVVVVVVGGGEGSQASSVSSSQAWIEVVIAYCVDASECVCSVWGKLAFLK